MNPRARACRFHPSPIQTERKTIMANKGSFLATGQYLDVGDYLVAANAQYFAILQSDGNLVQYNGTGANPYYELPARWASNTMRAQGQYFALLRNDGHLVLSHTASNIVPGDIYWDSQLGLITVPYL